MVCGCWIEVASPLISVNLESLKVQTTVVWAVAAGAQATVRAEVPSRTAAHTLVLRALRITGSSGQRSPQQPPWNTGPRA